MSRRRSTPIMVHLVAWLVGAITVGGVGFLISSFSSQPPGILSPQRKIIFVGKLINTKTNEWPNDRLVLVYLHGKEIGRTISATGEFTGSTLGVVDGLFTIPVDNTYKLTLANFKLVNEELRTTTELTPTVQSGIDYFSGSSYMWFKLEEGSQIQLRVPSKNITYVLKSVMGDVSSLPTQLLAPNSTRLTENNEIIVSLSGSTPNRSQNISSESVSNIGDIHYVNTETTVIPLNPKISFPVKNCVDSTFSTTYNHSQTFIHEYQAEVNGQVGSEVSLPIPIIQPKLFASLQAKYGFEQGQVETSVIEYHIEAKPHTNQVYVFTLKEVWESGKAIVVAGKDTIIIPFKVKTDLIYDVKSEDLGCN